jgi:hypothetical protein
MLTDIEGPKRLGRGLYHGMNLNLELGDAMVDQCPQLGKLATYGVCDDPVQFLAAYQDFLESDRRCFVVGFEMVCRCDEPKTGGWRWEKWGPYIGSKKRTADYLADEKDIV